MGSFSNTVFSILLGWLQILVSMIWSALTEKDGHSFLEFIGNHWLILAAVLCAIGLAADFTVYLFRWQPYKVWKTFRKRIRNRREEKQAALNQEEENISEPSFHFSSGPETEDENEHAEAPAADMMQEDEIGSRRRPVNRRRNRFRMEHLLGEDPEEGSFHYASPQPIIDQKEAYHSPVYPEKWTGSRNQES